MTLPDDDTTAAMYELAIERLAAAGYAQYEISNWARGAQDGWLPAQACHHNVAYWLNADYLACGAGAHGHRYPQRWHDVLAIDDYLAAVARDGHAVAETTTLTAQDLWGETMMMGLRLNVGVSAAHFRDRCGVELTAVYGAVIEGLVAEGLLISDAVGVRLTDRGRLFGNQVFMRFLLDPVPA